MASSRAWNVGMASDRNRYPQASATSRALAMDDFLHMPFDQLREEMGAGVSQTPSSSSPPMQVLRRAASEAPLRHAPPGSRSSGTTVTATEPRSMDEMERMVRTLMAISSSQLVHRAPRQSQQMSYEQMIQLDGSNARRCVKPSAIRRLEKRTPTREETKSKCQICLNQLGSSSRHVLVLPCKHPFCDGCITKWLGTSNTCPVCRWEFPDQDTQLRTSPRQAGR